MEAALEAGKFYEYSQQAKSKFFKLKLRRKEKEMTELVDTVMAKLVEVGEKSLVRDFGEYYFENWVKDTKEFDDFFFKICKLAFIHGDKENKYAFLKRMIKFSYNKTRQLSELMAETCKEEKQYLKAYVYSFKANKPYMTIELLQDHIIKEGYTNEVELFKIRAVLEYISFNLLDSAQICIDKLWDKDEYNSYKNIGDAILLCIKKDRFDIFRQIPEFYKAIFATDPNLAEYLGKISKVHFKKPLKEPSAIKQMFQSMFA